jgi:predicted dehydrogenase
MEVKTKKNVVLVGIGLFALEKARLIQKSDNWNVCGAVDLSVAAVARFEFEFSDYNIPLYRNIPDLVRELSFDVVLVTSTAPSHVEITESFLEVGYAGSFLIEKPISNSVLKAERLANKLKSIEARALVDYSRRFSDIYADIFNIAKNGELGKLKSIEVNWRGGISMNGSHFIDLGCLMFGVAPLSVKAKLERQSSASHRGSFYFDPPGVIDVLFVGGASMKVVIKRKEESVEDSMKISFDNGVVLISQSESKVVIEGGSGEALLSTFAKDEMKMEMKNRTWLWYERCMDYLISGDSSGYRPCEVKDSIVSLEVIVAAFFSNENGGKEICIPLSSSQKEMILRIA